MCCFRDVDRVVFTAAPLHHIIMKTTVVNLGQLAVGASILFGRDQQAKPPAAPPNSPIPEGIFKNLDTNADGFLSFDQFKASPLGQRDAAKAEAILKRMDAHADGKVTLHEFTAYGPHRGNRGGNQPVPAPTATPVN